jgi:hypothetical protein
MSWHRAINPATAAARHDSVACRGSFFGEWPENHGQTGQTCTESLDLLHVSDLSRVRNRKVAAAFSGHDVIGGICDRDH